MARTTRQNVQTLLTPDEWAAAKSAAALDGRALSAWIRTLVVAAARRRLAKSGTIHLPTRPCGARRGTELATGVAGIEQLTCDACRRIVESA
jgi:hypothetical protein